MPVSAIDRAIIQTLGFGFRAMSIREISEQTGISWITVRSHITRLKRAGIVTEIVSSGGRYYYKLSSRLY